MLDADNWRDFARAHANTSPREKRRKLLDDDYPVIDARSAVELDYLLRDLKRRGYDDWQEAQAVRLTLDGWEQLEPVPGMGIPGRCFVAMSCDASLDDAYVQGILPAVEQDCRCAAILVEKEQHNDKICDRVLAEIRLAHFIVADVTLHRQNVYFEAGFAMGLGRDVIWTCREDEFTRDKQHFDTRQYPHILWTSPRDLRQRLADKIRATILQ